MKRYHQREVIELRVPGCAAEVVAPDGSCLTLQSFRKADGLSYVRYASSLTGVHRYTAGTESGDFDIVPYEGDNPLYLHGAIKASEDRRYLTHEDGAPFFYLADTWWMGFTKRLSFPDGFSELTRDRVEKGFTVVQIVAGLYPDMDPFDPRGMNEAGFPWDEGFTEINNAYFDAADRRIAHLVENGIAPCIVGCWGFFIKFAGADVIKRHWDNLMTRWGAYPVIWCLAGEALMPFYNDPAFKNGGQTADDYRVKIRAAWTEVAAHVRFGDPFHRLITIHPNQNGHEQVDDERLLDLDMLQTGHSGYLSLLPTLKQVRAAVNRHAMPVINSEACYEGICGSSLSDVQRYLFCSNILTGCCGYAYGANGIWQLNARAESYGASPHGSSWGDTPWEEAYRLPGSAHIGNCKRFLMKFEWWRFEPHPEWVAKPCGYEALDGSFCAGIPGEARLIFTPLFGGTFWGEDEVLELDGPYYAYYFDPIQDKIRDLGRAVPDEEGRWTSPRYSIFQDWLLALTKKPLD